MAAGYSSGTGEAAPGRQSPSTVMGSDQKQLDGMFSLNLSGALRMLILAPLSV